MLSHAMAHGLAWSADGTHLAWAESMNDTSEVVAQVALTGTQSVLRSTVQLQPSMLVWQGKDLYVDDAAAEHWYPLGLTTLVLRHPVLEEVSITAHALSSSGRAVVNQATLGGRLVRLIAHFTNLPRILPASGLSQQNSQWPGRWQAAVVGGS